MAAPDFRAAGFSPGSAHDSSSGSTLLIERIALREPVLAIELTGRQSLVSCSKQERIGIGAILLAARDLKSSCFLDAFERIRADGGVCANGLQVDVATCTSSYMVGEMARNRCDCG